MYNNKGKDTTKAPPKSENRGKKGNAAGKTKPNPKNPSKSQPNAAKGTPDSMILKKLLSSKTLTPHKEWFESQDVNVAIAIAKALLEYIKDYMKETNKKSGINKLTEEDFTPKSLRFKFDLQAPETLKSTEKYKKHKDDSEKVLEETAKKLTEITASQAKENFKKMKLDNGAKNLTNLVDALTVMATFESVVMEPPFQLPSESPYTLRNIVAITLYCFLKEITDGPSANEEERLHFQNFWKLYSPFTYEEKAYKLLHSLTKKDNVQNFTSSDFLVLKTAIADHRALGREFFFIFFRP